MDLAIWTHPISPPGADPRHQQHSPEDLYLSCIDCQLGRTIKCSSIERFFYAAEEVISAVREQALCI